VQLHLNIMRNQSINPTCGTRTSVC